MRLIISILAIIVISSSILSIEQDLDDKLSSNMKFYGLAQVWKEAEYNFAFFNQIPDLNWDSTFQEFIPQVMSTSSIYEYYRTLERFIALLKDGHTYIVYPPTIRDSITSPPIVLGEVGGQSYIINLDKKLENKIPIGSKITRVDGIEYNEYLRKKVLPFICASAEHTRIDRGVSRLLRGWINTNCIITYETPNYELMNITLTRNSSNVEWLLPLNESRKLIELNWLDNKIALLEINSFNEDSVVIQFEKILPELLSAKGVIIDLRLNNGGNSNHGAAILSHFTTDTLYGSKWKTRIHVAAYKAWSKYFDEYKLYGEGDAWQEESDWKYEPTSGKKISAPVVVLIGRKTRSAAEDFLIFADPLPQFTFVGEPSAGSTGQPLIFYLPGGGFAGIVSKRDQYPDGRDFVGYGVQPDYFIKRTLEDLLGYSDLTLEKGIDILKQKIE